MVPNEFELRIALQEYLESLAAANSPGTPEERRAGSLLRSYAELRFKLYGGGHCALCNVHVRLVIPVTVERDGECTHYPCLCVRCLESERATARTIKLRLGGAEVEYPGGEGRQPG